MDALNRVLIVDDESGPRRSLEMALAGHFDVTSTNSGAKALDLLRRERFDAVLLDLVMPQGLSGTETLRAIREAAIEVEVVVLTGSCELDAAIECLRLGARDYIAKPYRVEGVRSVLRKILAPEKTRAATTVVEREEILAHLSHEFRTPLHAICGYTEILNEEVHDVLSEDQRQALERIQSNSRRLLSYLEGLFFLAESEIGPVATPPREFAVRPLLEKVLKSTHGPADCRTVEVEIQCDDDLTGHAHPETLTRLLTALTQAAVESPVQRPLRLAAKRTTANSLELRLDPGDPALGDPMAREVVRRAASRLDARVRSQARGVDTLGVHIEVPESSTGLGPQTTTQLSATNAGTGLTP